MRKMGQHGSPTGEVFLSDVRAGRDRLLGEREDPKGGADKARATTSSPSVPASPPCPSASSKSASTLDRLREAPSALGTAIADYQLIQLKLAQMEVARVNVRNMVFAHIERSSHGAVPSFAEASAMKLYSAQAACQVADDAIQIFGGNGYIAEYRVEQLSRDARVLRIYAGTDEMQVIAIAKDLIRDYSSRHRVTDVADRRHRSNPCTTASTRAPCRDSRATSGRTPRASRTTPGLTPRSFES